MISVAVLVPVLERPQRVQPLLESLRASQQQIPLNLLFIVSASDQGELETVDASGADYLVADWESGHADFARKIQLGFEATTDPFILIGADDLTFGSGWADAAIKEIERTGAGVCGTQDNANPLVIRGNHSTHPLVRRSYVDQQGASLDGPGIVLTNAYWHLCVDNEICELAKARGLWTFCQQAVVNHNHPIYDRKVQMDATYTKGMSQSRADIALYKERSKRFLRAFPHDPVPVV